MTDTCEKCGRAVEVGSFPFCPHAAAANSVVGDDWPGGKTFENGFDRPMTFYSRSEHAAALAARGLEVRAKWAGPNDKHLSRMDAPCAQTLENAKALLSRGKVSRDVEPAYEPIPITVTTIRYEKES